MAAPHQPSGAATHRAAAAYLDQLAELLARRATLDETIDQLIRDRPAGVTREHVADLLGITVRGLAKRLAS